MKTLWYSWNTRTPAMKEVVDHNFCALGSQEPFNVCCMQVDVNHLVSRGGGT